MIYYENTGFKSFFTLKGSVLQKAMKWSITYSVLSLLLCIFFHHGESISGVEIIDVAHLQTMDFGGRLRDFTFVLGFFISFCTQKAYSRWWEGGTLLQQLRGEWFNAFSSLLAFSNPDPKMNAQVQRFQHMLARMISLMYAQALMQVSSTERVFELIDITGFDAESLDFLYQSHDGCEVVLQWLQRAIVEANGKGIIMIAPPILSRVYNQLGNGIVRLNNARKIHEFPIPFPIAQMVFFQLICHGILTSFVCAIVVENPGLAFIFTFLVCQSLWTIHYITLELEQPYGTDANDLPLEEMMVDLNHSLCNLLDSRAREPPPYVFDHEIDSSLARDAIHLGEFIALLKENKEHRIRLGHGRKTLTRMQRGFQDSAHVKRSVVSRQIELLENRIEKKRSTEVVNANVECSLLVPQASLGSCEYSAVSGGATDQQYDAHTLDVDLMAAKSIIPTGPIAPTSADPGFSAEVDNLRVEREKQENGTMSQRVAGPRNSRGRSTILAQGPTVSLKRNMQHSSKA
eukprot:TRINITY_DN10075_c1_g1_i2.p1 TRINITY_DN10075_c1_g1~~TRINITY_DN10075_c1_g1_i2.p1  ORF type:complete len:516 (+),score=64.58 TRINITY_DN10075_c1_g1_i2:144-1691(+)